MTKSPGSTGVCSEPHAFGPMILRDAELLHRPHVRSVVDHVRRQLVLLARAAAGTRPTGPPISPTMTGDDGAPNGVLILILARVRRAARRSRCRRRRRSPLWACPSITSPLIGRDRHHRPRVSQILEDSPMGLAIALCQLPHAVSRWYCPSSSARECRSSSAARGANSGRRNRLSASVHRSSAAPRAREQAGETSGLRVKVVRVVQKQRLERRRPLGRTPLQLPVVRQHRVLESHGNIRVDPGAPRDRRAKPGDPENDVPQQAPRVGVLDAHPRR